MEFLRSRTNAVDQSIREYREVESEYLKADEDLLSDKQIEELKQRLRSAADALIDSAERLRARIDGES
jgi:hypothetical protein